MTHERMTEGEMRAVEFGLSREPRNRAVLAGLRLLAEIRALQSDIAKVTAERDAARSALGFWLEYNDARREGYDGTSVLLDAIRATEEALSKEEA